MDEGISKDLDETRRLLYMALYRPRTERAELVGTVVNALAHHSLGLDPDEVADQLISWLEDGHGNASEWVRARIADLTARLDES
jgi:alkanesulfonate monooxygenase SsuD/methylene tetrahydromethanopterin reductase-like flavin-dependent oxidoreductase (luciferase family)